MVLVDRSVRINIQESGFLGPSGVRKEWPQWVGFLLDHDDEVAYFLGVLDGTEPCPPQVADPRDGLTSLSLNIAAWPPNRYGLNHPDCAFIVGCHKNLLLLCLRDEDGGFYMVYNTKAKANSIAVVPRRVCCSLTHFPIARVRWQFQGVTILRLSTSEEHDQYLLAELLFRTEDRSGLDPTNKATLFLWRSITASDQAARGPICNPYICLTPDKVPPFPQCLDMYPQQWIPMEVELPLPTDRDHHPSFRADMTLATGAATLYWVDLLQGILVSNHKDRGNGKQQQPFHFIPLPPEAYADVSINSNPHEYRSMCCIKGGALKFVSMEGYNREDIPMAEVVLITWILTNPQSRTKWKWQLFESVRIGDLWHNPHYHELPLLPHFPVISTVEPHVIYFTVFDYKYDPEYEVMEATERYVLGVDMHLRSVVSAFMASSSRMLTSHFTRYINQRTVCPMEKEVTDEGDPAAWASVWISTKPLGVSPVEPAHKAGRLGGRVSSDGVAQFISKTGPTMSSITPVIGLQCVLGH